VANLDDLVQDILDNVDIVDVVSKYVPLKRAGSNYKALCPFHREKTPSFVVSPHKQLFKCFWCWIGGNAIKFVMEYERIGFREAIKLLAKEAKIDLSKYNLQEKKSSPQNIAQKEKIYQLNQAAQKFFHEQLKQSPQAKEYLRQRNLSLPIWTKFWLGYAPESYKTINFLLQQGFDEQTLLTAWLAKKKQDQLVSFFENRLMFPLPDQFGNIVGFAGRALQEDQMPKYINTWESPVYDKSKYLYWLYRAKNEYKDVGGLVVVEGYMDVIGLFRIFGKSAGVATSWTALTSSHVKILKRFGDEIFLSFDNDQAGKQATIRALSLMREQWLFPKIITLTQHKDFDELANALEQPLQKLESNEYFKIQEGFDWLVERLAEDYSLNDPVGIKKAKEILVNALSALDPNTDYAVLNLYLQKAANLLKTSKEVLLEEVLKAKKRGSHHQQYKKEADLSASQQDQKALLLAALFLDWFGSSLWLPSEFLNTSAQILKNLADYLPSSLKQTLEWNLSLETKEQIKLKQLEIEQTFNPQKLEEFKTLIKTLINHFVKSTIKFLSPQQKQEVSSLYRKLTQL